MEDTRPELYSASDRRKPAGDEPGAVSAESNNPMTDKNDRFVVDGYERLVKGLQDEFEKIKAAVRAEYAETLEAARWWWRPFVELQIRGEIKRRVRERLPDKALFLQSR